MEYFSFNVTFLVILRIINKRTKMSIDYSSMPKNPKQDNKSYLNIGSRWSNARKVRFPKLVRKTAWKRFYKLFPHLDRMNKLMKNL